MAIYHGYHPNSLVKFVLAFVVSAIRTLSTLNMRIVMEIN